MDQILSRLDQRISHEQDDDDAFNPSSLQGEDEERRPIGRESLKDNLDDLIIEVPEFDGSLNPETYLE